MYRERSVILTGVHALAHVSITGTRLFERLARLVIKSMAESDLKEGLNLRRLKMLNVDAANTLPVKNYITDT